MGTAANINLRLPDSLKQHGNQVLERNGVSTTEAIRKLYEYLERNQDIPSWMKKEKPLTKYEKRRAIARKYAGADFVSKDTDARAEYRDHLMERYGKVNQE